MSLAAGTRLGGYTIAAPLGAGGMGEVYRASDTKLGREVAIKVLPAEVAGDAERLARFEREAKLLASLNHPNIAHVYGFESARLGDGSAAHFLAMELVEGEDLAARLKRGAIPVDEALAIAKQIAEAFEEAHEKGIVHRDLKPANVKVTPDGKVKVLDFGLAKAYTGEPASGSGRDLSQSPTLAHTGTQAGVILGTAAYMSPEQARGKAVDKRADIWAFGVVLWEMLTGKPLFAGETVSDVLAGVLKTDVDLGALPDAAPPPVRELLRRCLERNPRNRLHDVADARIVLDDALEGRGDGASVESGPTPRRAWAARLGWLGLGALVGAAIVVVARSPRAAGTASEPERPFSLRRLTELPGAELQPTLSPDGRMVVYASAAAGNLDLYLQRVGGDRAIPLTTGVADDSQPAFSPDGERIAFRSERDGGGLFVMGSTGESVRRVTDAGFDPAWSPDGRRLAYSTEPVIDPTSRYGPSELWVVEVDSGKRTRRLAGDAVQPVWSRDGRRLAYWANTDGQRDLWTVAVDGGEPVAVTQDVATDWSPEWSPDDRWLYFSSDRGGSFNLWRIAIDPATGGAAGAPQPVSSGVRGLAYARFARDGSRLSVLAYERSYEQTIEAVETQQPIRLRPLRTLRNPSARWCKLSPDGGELACSTAGTPEDLVVMRSDGRELRRLTSDVDKDRNLSWSPDGRRLAFSSTRSGSWQYWTIGADGSDLRDVAEAGGALSWTWLDDRRALVSDAEEGRSRGLLVLDTARQATPASARTVPPQPETLGLSECAADQAGERAVCALAPDWRVLKGFSLIDLRRGSLRRFDVPTAGRIDLSVGGWMSDGRRVIVRAADGLRELDVETGASRVIRPAGVDANVSLSRDASTLMVEYEILDSDVWLLEYQ